MSIEVTYSEARNNLASILDQVTNDSEVVVIKRRGRSSVAMIDADELSSLMETEYLFRSPKNAERLLNAIRQTDAGGGEVTTVEQLRKEFDAEKPVRKTNRRSK
ncbi:MAG: type II toxin-antitoxin system prevent-host-death family antitoxin [Acidobacteria bacterium]|nr:type II toxin-antitoxin system prevent-host-death family antitoxin [Acidobacteriota bacterium]